MKVVDGWIEGELLGPRGQQFEVHHDPEPPHPALAEVEPNLVLHTTETSGIASWDFPPQFTVGQGIVLQHRPLWAKGEALRGDTTNDPYAMQIEIVGYSKLDVWLPAKSSLEPLVALVAFLHQRGFIRTGLVRPADWPTRLDRGPQAVESYYRRQAGLWPSVAGVYGHVDIPGNTHWDPGSFDYPEFFRMVRDVLSKETDVGYAEFKDGVKRHKAGRPKPGPDGDPDVIFGWQFREDAVTNPLPSAPASHEHEVTGRAT